MKELNIEILSITLDKGEIADAEIDGRVRESNVKMEESIGGFSSYNVCQTEPETKRWYFQVKWAWDWSWALFGNKNNFATNNCAHNIEGNLLATLPFTQ